MNTMKWLVLILSCALITVSVSGECSPRKPEADAGIKMKCGLVIQMEEYKRQATAENGMRASVALIRPRFVSGAGEATLQKFNEWVNSRVCPSDNGKPPSMSESGKSFLDLFMACNTEGSESEGGWELERRVTITDSGIDYVSLEFYESQAEGGIHGDTSIELISISPSTGNPLTLNDLFAGDFEEPLREAGEKAFRKARHIMTAANLREAGFDFSGDRFYLKNNFCILQRDLQFIFNKGEIARNSKGMTRVKVPLLEMRRFFSANGIFKKPGKKAND